MGLGRLAVTVECVRPECTLAEAAHLLIRDAVHALLVTEEESGVLVGILTDRDVVRQVAHGSDPGTTTVAGFMSKPVATLPESAPRSEVTAKMRTHGVRHVPLVDETGKITGIVSLDDLLTEFGQELGDVSAAIRGEFRHEVEKTNASR